MGQLGRLVIAGGKLLVETPFRQACTRTDIVNGDRFSGSLRERTESRVQQGITALPHPIRIVQPSIRQKHRSDVGSATWRSGPRAHTVPFGVNKSA
ncbi:hypothetical protein FHU29_001535 [Hoyosella altamirensis]|uniref:Uncharacterized protein n=1 Tax=Hoyosella altamirensis TaxID=616997 RepID=A0A839RME0_9ACTN|nr:hypothetical protein [Hoyosella altamirensis]